MFQRLSADRHPLQRSVMCGALVAVLLGVMAVGSGSTAAQGTTASAPNRHVTMKFLNAPIQTALRALFESTGKNFTIGPAVRGTVNVNLAGVSFGTALRTLLAATNPPLTSDIQNGIYHITRKRIKPRVIAARPAQPTAPAKKEALSSYSIPVDSYDAGILASMLNPRARVEIVPPNYVNPGGAAKSNGGNNRNGSNGRAVNQSGRGGSRYPGH